MRINKNIWALGPLVSDPKAYRLDGLLTVCGRELTGKTDGASFWYTLRQSEFVWRWVLCRMSLANLGGCYWKESDKSSCFFPDWDEVSRIWGDKNKWQKGITSPGSSHRFHAWHHVPEDCHLNFAVYSSISLLWPVSSTSCVEEVDLLTKSPLGYAVLFSAALFRLCVSSWVALLWTHGHFHRNHLLRLYWMVDGYSFEVFYTRGW